MHPDRAPAALIRRIGFSLYVQSWLPYLDEVDAQALLARTGLPGFVPDPSSSPGVAGGTCPASASSVAG